MVFYFLAVRPWVEDMNKIACIEIAGNRKVNLSDVKSITCLMNRPAMPIRNITFKYEDSGGHTSDGSGEKPINVDETLGETLKRMKKGESLKDHIRRRGSAAGMNNSKKKNGKQKQKAVSSNNSQTGSKKAVKAAKWKRNTSEQSIPKSALPQSQPSEASSSAELAVRATPPTIVVDDDDEGDLASLKSEKSNRSFRRIKIKNLLQEKLRTSLAFGREPVVEFEFDANEFFGGSDNSDITETQNSHDIIQVPGIEKAVKEEQLEAEIKEEQDAEKEEAEGQPIKSCMKVSTLDESLQSLDRPSLPPLRRRSLDAPPSVPSRRKSFSTEDAKNVFGGLDKDGLSDTTSYSRDDSIASRDGRLRWGSIVIREYSQCLGDNPACSNGVPLQLDWDYRLMDTVLLDEFEKAREPNRQSDNMSLRIPSSYRQALMFKLGYSASEMAAVNRVKQRDQKRRIQTVSRLKYMSFGERVEKMAKVFPAAAAQTAQRAS